MMIERVDCRRAEYVFLSILLSLTARVSKLRRCSSAVCGRENYFLIEETYTYSALFDCDVSRAKTIGESKWEKLLSVLTHLGEADVWSLEMAQVLPFEH